MLTTVIFFVIMAFIFSLPVLAFTGVLEAMATGKPIHKVHK